MLSLFALDDVVNSFAFSLEGDANDVKEEECLSTRMDVGSKIGLSIGSDVGPGWKEGITQADLKCHEFSTSSSRGAAPPLLFASA